MEGGRGWKMATGVVPRAFEAHQELMSRAARCASILLCELEGISRRLAYESHDFKL